MVIAHEPLWLHVADVRDGLDGHAVFLQAEAFSGKDLLVGGGCEGP
jgi:hypothetical protein